MLKRRFIQLVLISLLVIAIFDSRSFCAQVSVNETTINIPTPAGFYEIKRDENPRDFSVHYNNALPKYTLRTIFRHEKHKRPFVGEYPEARTYILVMTDKLAEPYKLTASDFKEVHTALQSGYLDSQEYRDDLDNHILQSKDKLNRQYSTTIDYQNEAMIPLGVFLKTPTSLGIAAYQAAKIGFTPEKTTLLEQVIGTNLVLIKGKLLTIYVYTSYKSKADVEWVKSFSKQWIEQIQKLNSQ